MQLVVLPFPAENYFHEEAERLNELNLVRYASEAANDMGFENEEELVFAVKRSMELCIAAGIPLNSNFRRVYKASSNGLLCDWKLSVLAYRLVELNGNGSNPNVATMQVNLLKDYFGRS